ncbi:MAG: MFS transporter [Betaproteobacteria bacterium]|nr:MFS transporter [Betaproteobacteria bacterium]
MCAGQVGNLLPHVVVPAVMVGHLIPLWGLSNAQAGLLAASYAAGYMLAVPVLASLTDRIDARVLLGVGSLASSAATLAFGWLAQGLFSAMLLWALAGVGFAGAYMPGLRALTDRLDPGDASRSVTFYTSSYSLGVGMSFLVSQLVAETLGWRWSFTLTGLGPLVMVAAAARMRPVPPPPRPPGARLLDFRPVLRNRTAMGYILGYAAHCFELYGMRTWIVAFWTFVAARHGGQAVLEPITVSVLVTLLAMPASILGNECAIRYGRHRAITVIQVLSAATALSIGLMAGGPPGLLLALVLVYAVTVPADSGSLTAGMSASADPRFKGATLAMHSMAGFGLSALAGWLVGVALDAFGGSASPGGWLAAFAVLGAGVLAGPFALRWSLARPPG